MFKERTLIKKDPERPVKILRGIAKRCLQA